MNAIIILSGGLDSSVVAYQVKSQNPNKIKCIFYDYGQRTRKQEEFAARKISKNIQAEFIKIDILWLGEISTSLINSEKKVHKTTEKDMENIQREKEDIINWWVPCRNSIFINIALAHAESEFISKKEKYDIFLGIKDEGKVHFKDTTPEFLKIMNKMQEHATDAGNYKISSPIINKDKVETVELGNKLNVPFELTYSCYKSEPMKNGKLIHCGYCSNCMQRKKAFYFAGIRDPSEYKN
ncbi:7-cyano-7-deazaguanine synthase [Candidatus Woesearchaeota archaeon]|nr:7-cyano-7-deazaguanine synthase [Candidatus Woesearchaeota archaeon]